MLSTFGSTLAPQFNPFRTTGLYSTYVRWTEKSDSYMGSTYGLIPKKTYKVVSANIGKSCTTLYLQDIESGKILESGYNSCYFTEIPGAIGISNQKPVIGKRFEMQKIEITPNGFCIRGWSTSLVQGIEQVSSNVWNVITFNSVYTVLIQ